MFIYWGARNSGKQQALQHCYYNNEPSSVLREDHILMRTNVECDGHINEIDWKAEYNHKVYTKQDSFKYNLVEDTKGCKHFKDSRNSYGTEYYPQIDRSRQVPGDRRVKQGQYRQYTGVYKPPFSLSSIGVDKTNIIIQLPANACNDTLMRQLKKLDHINVLPYRKMDRVKSLISKVHMWNPEKYNFEYEDVFDCYERNKDLFIEYLSQFFKDQRDLELLLQQNGVEYVHYDMDTRDLASVTGLEKNVIHPDGPEDYKVWNFDDPDTKKRFDMTVSMCEEFLKVTGLTDTRLEYRAKDGI